MLRSSLEKVGDSENDWPTKHAQNGGQIRRSEKQEDDRNTSQTKAGITRDVWLILADLILIICAIFVAGELVNSYSTFK